LVPEAYDELLAPAVFHPFAGTLVLRPGRAGDLDGETFKVYVRSCPLEIF
jgi:hypothetical protein